MLADFLNGIVNLGRAADKAEIIDIPGDPRRKILRQGKTTEYLTVPPPERDPKVMTFSDLCAAVKDSAICPSPEIYYGIKGADVFCDRADRRAKVQMALCPSQRWKAVESMKDGIAFTAKEAIQFLRFQLGGAEAMITALRQVDFNRTSSGKSVHEHGRESLGKSVEASVQQADQIPDRLVVSLCPVTNVGFHDATVTIDIGVTIDFEMQRFVFRLLPDALSVATNVFVTAFGLMLAKALPTVPAFYGCAG